MAERVGFEPTVQLPAHMISSHACSTGLQHLSENLEQHKIPSYCCIAETLPVLSKSLLQSLAIGKSMEQTGFEPVASSVRGMRSPN